MINCTSGGEKVSVGGGLKNFGIGVDRPSWGGGRPLDGPSPIHTPPHIGQPWVVGRSSEQMPKKRHLSYLNKCTPTSFGALKVLDCDWYCV